MLYEVITDRVLSGQYEEGLRQMIGRGTYGDVVFLHGLEQRRLRLRRGAVDLVGQEHLGEDRPLREIQPAMAGGDVEFEDLGA